MIPAVTMHVRCAIFFDHAKSLNPEKYTVKKRSLPNKNEIKASGADEQSKRPESLGVQYCDKLKKQREALKAFALRNDEFSYLFKESFQIMSHMEMLRRELDDRSDLHCRLLFERQKTLVEKKIKIDREIIAICKKQKRKDLEFFESMLHDDELFMKFFDRLHNTESVRSSIESDFSPSCNVVEDNLNFEVMQAQVDDLKKRTQNILASDYDNTIEFLDAIIATLTKATEHNTVSHDDDHFSNNKKRKK